MSDFDDAVDRFNEGLLEFVKGDFGPALRSFSERDDVVLCNPFLPFARGPDEVARTTEEAASHMADGTLEVERVVAFSTADLGYVVQIERFAATIDGQQGSGALRVTLIFRREGDGWKVSHRHADPITTPRATGSILQA